MCLTAITIALQFLYPDDVEAQLFAFILLPMIGALLRASVGVHQLRRFTGALIWWRQLLLAIAIVLLLVMEAASALVVFAADDPGFTALDAANSGRPLRVLPAGCHSRVLENGGSYFE